MAPKIICFFNGKGGVGKTTSAVNIGALLALKRPFPEDQRSDAIRVLVVDTDLQANCTSMLVDEVHRSLLDLLMEGGDVNDFVGPSNFSDLDILPISNAGVKEETIHINSFTDREQTLKRHLSALQKQYDYIIIDCPPAINEFTKNALVASTHVMIPFKADAYNYEGLARLLDKVDEYKQLYRLDTRVLGLFLTHFQNTLVNTQTRGLLDQDFSELVFGSTIRNSKLFSESTYERKPLVIYKPWDPVSFDYVRLAKEMIERMEE